MENVAWRKFVWNIGADLTGFSGFLGFHGILHESYVIVAIGIIGLILLITDFIRIKKNNR